MYAGGMYLRAISRVRVCNVYDYKSNIQRFAVFSCLLAQSRCCYGRRRRRPCHCHCLRIRRPCRPFSIFFFFCFAPARTGGQRNVSVVRVGGPRRREPRCHWGRELGGGLCGPPRGRFCREQAHHRREQCGYRCVRVYCCNQVSAGAPNSIALPWLGSRFSG